MVRRYPLADLVKVSRRTPTWIMQATRLSGREYQRYRDQGMSALVASRLANACGFHPCEVWPSWFDDAEAERKARHAEYMRRWRRRNRARAQESVRRYRDALGPAAIAARRAKDAEYQRQRRQAS